MWERQIPGGLAQRLSGAGAEVAEGELLRTRTTLRVGGPARILAECFSTDVLIDVIRMLDADEVPVLVMGGGSNLLISDDGFDGVVVVISTSDVSFGADSVVADAGVSWDLLVAESVDKGFGGLECLSGIPGSVGATPVQNVGAYGVEVASLLTRVRMLDRRTGSESWVLPEELGLAYRTSTLKNTDTAVVLAVEFRVRSDGTSEPLMYRELASALGCDEGERRPAADVRAAVLALRGSKGMVLDASDPDTWSAGSFFTNPIVAADDLPAILDRIREHVGDVRIPQFPAEDGTVKLSAGWLIERAGFGKGFPGEGHAARLSTKHTLAVTNRGTAGSAEIVDLARTVRDGVRDKFGVALHPEPVTIGCTL